MSKKIIIVTLFVLVLGLYYFNFFEFFNDFNKLRQLIINSGYFGYFLFILFFIIAALFSLHGSILAIIGGIVYGPILGGFISVIGGTLGAIVAFLVSRYLFKNTIEAKLSDNTIYKKIYEGVKKNGTDYLIVTRLVIIFPYNIQNYIYGLTDISFIKYSLITFVTIIPGTFLYTFLANELVLNNFTLSIDTLIKVIIGGILLAALAILPKKYFEKKGKINID